MDMTKFLKRGRGRGGRGGGGGGRGRGRGRGSAGNRSLAVINRDDDDEVCNMALAQAELESNSLTRSFEELNAAEDLPGFDKYAGSMWIYPTNRPVRDYQYEIVKTALFNNTLVSLPTGLGKTFISAVVMYNFQRWYPSGIIVFMAPTRPLVTQQLDACHNTVGISPAKTVELTGQIAPKKREQLWKNKTVFFLTPQVMISDLERNFFPPENVRCIVVDEAHKAVGNHAYVQVIAKIAEKHRLFRVLALSATPGSDLSAVQQVFKNLLISRVELRSENCNDILPYIHEKKVEKIVVRLDAYLRHIHAQVVEVFQIYSGKLLKVNALTGRDGASFAKFQLLKARETFRSNMAPKMPHHQKGYIEVDFAVCISLSHAIEILLSHGLRTFYIFLQGVLNKEKGNAAVTSELRKNSVLQNVLDEIQRKLNISIENSTFDFDLSNASALFTTIESPKVNRPNLPNRSFIQEDVDFTLSHPKLKVLKDVVHKHFVEYQCKNASTRVMIFSQFRDSVQEIGNMLNSLKPMVKPMVFIGQANTSAVGRGLKQKDQVQVVQQFRDGGFNVLVSTSVGEEGLDIGEVDLIICFDASKSPTRLIQRMGRTGRQREGRTVFLLTEGKEERCYNSSVSTHSSISKSITDPDKLKPFLYKQSPRMVPTGINPDCYKMSIILATEQSSQPEPMQVDLTQDENGESSKPVAQNAKNKKPAAKKTKDTGGAASKKSASNTIAKMFDKMTKAASQKTPKENEPVPYENDNNYVFEEGMHMYANHNIKAYSSLSIYPKIFDIDKKERLEWKPCTTFLKKKLPPSSLAASSSLLNNFEALLLDDKELSTVEFNVKSRESFVYMQTDFCGCGNTMEPHGADIGHAAEDNANRKNEITLEEPFIDEDFFEEIPQEILEQLDAPFDPSPVNAPENLQPSSPPSVNIPGNNHASYPAESRRLAEFFPKSPVKKESSDEFSDTQSEFSASPQAKPNVYLEGLWKRQGKIPPTKETLPSSAPLHLNPVIDNNPVELTSVQSSMLLSTSAKKFKFKKKPQVNLSPEVKNMEVDVERDESPSPPLSPILKLPTVTNDLYTATSPKPRYRSQNVSNAMSHEPLVENFIDEDFSGILDDPWFPSQPSTPVKAAPEVVEVVEKPTSVRKPVKFLKPTEHSSVNVLPDDLLEQPYRKTVEMPSTSAAATSKICSAKKIGGFHTEFIKQSQAKKSITEGKFALFVKPHTPDSPTGSSVGKTLSRNRPVIKLAREPNVLKYSSENLNVPEPMEEPRPIVKPPTYSNTLVSTSARKQTHDAEDHETHRKDLKRIGVDTSARRENFSKSPSVSSTTSSTTSFNVKRREPGKNLLSRNRPRRPLISRVSSPFSPIIMTNKSKPATTTDSTNAAKIPTPMTPPKPVDPVSSDESPEIVFQKTRSPRPSFLAKNKSVSENREPTSPKTPVSSRRSGNTSRFRVPEVPSPSHLFSGRKTPVQNIEPTSPITPVTPIVRRPGNAGRLRLPESPSSHPSNATTLPSITPNRTSTTPNYTFTTPTRYSSTPIRRSTTTTPLSSRRLASSSRRSATGSCRTPTPLRYSSRETTRSPFVVSSVVTPSTADPSPYFTEQRNARKPRPRANQFIDNEAEVIDDDESELGDEEEFEYDGLDNEDDSFVTQDINQPMSDSQTAMYLESVKDAIPKRFGRIEQPLSPKNYDHETDMDATGEVDEDDSFVANNDDVEFAEEGVFTQAMNLAKHELAFGIDNGRQTRRKKREALALKPPVQNKPKQRRRIVPMDESSDDEDDDFR